MSKESTDPLATLASRMMGRNMVEEQRTAIADAVCKCRNADELTNRLVQIFKPYNDDVASLAGSVLSQAVK